MNEGMFNHIMEAFDALGKRLDQIIALLQTMQPSQVARDEAADKQPFIVRESETTGFVNMAPDAEMVTHDGTVFKVKPAKTTKTKSIEDRRKKFYVSTPDTGV